MHQEKILNRIIVIGALGVVVLAGFIVGPRIKNTTTKKVPEMPSYVFNGVTIKTELEKSFAESFHTFLLKTTKASRLPKEITLTRTAKAANGSGDVYTGNWNVNGTYMSALVTLTSNNSHINYQRVWMMPVSEPIDHDKANTLLSDIFDPSFLKEVGTVACKDIQGSPEVALTECGIMKTIDSGDLIGVTVKTPITLAPPPGSSPAPTDVVLPTVTVVSACFVPKEGTPMYTGSTCI
jgi:hypothetical protein